MSMRCRQDSNVDPNRAGAAHALPSGSCPASNGYTHTHSKWGTSGCPTWVWAPSWLGSGCQQYACCSTAQRSPHERSALCWLRYVALHMELQATFTLAASFFWVFLWAGVKLYVVKHGLCRRHAPCLLCHADGACMVVHASDMLHMCEKITLLQLKLHIIVSTHASHISISTHEVLTDAVDLHPIHLFRHSIACFSQRLLDDFFSQVS